MRGALGRGLHQPVFQHPGPEKGPDQPKQSPVRLPMRDPRHQPVLIDSVEEPLQIHVNHNRVTFHHMTLCPGYRLMGRTPRPKP